MILCDHFESTPLKNKNNFYIGYTNTTLSGPLTYHLSENRAIKQHSIIKHKHRTDQLTSSKVRKILTNNPIIIYKTNNKNDHKIKKQYA